MQTHLAIVPEPPSTNPADVIFEVKDGKVWVSSLEIARLFQREHYDVLKTIKRLEVNQDFAAGNFSAGSYKDPNNQERPMFMMTKKGYRRLTMDFQGAKATEIKEQLLDRFEELEEKESKPQPLALTGDFGALLIQAGQQIQEQNLVISKLNEANTTLANENITLNALIDDSDLIWLRQAAKSVPLF